MRHVHQSTVWPNLVPRAFPTHFLREKPWGRGWAWPVPHACAQPYHPCSGSHGQLSFYLSISLCTDYLSMPLLCYHFLPTSPSFLFPEARSYSSVPLIWSILGASRSQLMPQNCLFISSPLRFSNPPPSIFYSWFNPFYTDPRGLQEIQH